MALHASAPGRLIAVLLLATTGCASTSEYSRFARAGTAYATALDHLLVAAGTAGIDATSERLLQDDAAKNQDLTSYRMLTAIDEERSATIGRLRTHARLLAVYFGLLDDLATSDAPARAQAAVGGVVDSLNGLGDRLRRGPFIRKGEVVGEVMSLGVRSSARAALKRELELRKDSIRVELKTQEILLSRLADAIGHDLSIANSTREQRLVIAPLTDEKPISRPDEWVANRRKILTSQNTLEELTRGSAAAAELRRAFEDLISGRATLARIDALLTSVDGLLAVAAAVTR